MIDVLWPHNLRLCGELVSNQLLIAHAAVKEQY